MKIESRRLILYVFIIMQLFHGVIFELIVWMCMLYMIITQSNQIKKLVGKKTYILSVLFIAIYILLYIIQFRITPNVNLVRLFGLTKCICAPALLLLSFGDLTANKNIMKTLMLTMFIFNIIYTAALFFTGFDYSFSSSLGSYNGCATVGVIIFPCVLQFYKAQPVKSANRFFVKIYMVSFAVLLLVSGSTTAQVIFVLQAIAYLFARFRTHKLFRKFLRGAVIIFSIALIAFTFAIATGYIATTGTEIATRTAIWTRTYEYFISFDRMHIIFGTGNDIVQMMTKSLEAHNVFMEVLLIYGAVGLIILILYFVGLIRALIRFKSGNTLTIFLCLISYVLVCFIHPFYTGVFLFQTICILAFLSSIFAYSDNGGKIIYTKEVETT